MEQELRFGLDLGRMANFLAFIASKIFRPMEPPYTYLKNVSNNVAHFDVSKIYETLKKNTLNFLWAKKHFQLCLTQRYTYRVLQTIQMKLILLCVWAEWAILGSAKTGLRFKYNI